MFETGHLVKIKADLDKTGRDQKIIDLTFL